MVANAIGKQPRRATDILRSAGLTPFRQILDPAAFVRPADYKGLPLDLSKLGLGR